MARYVERAWEQLEQRRLVWCVQSIELKTGSI